MKNLLCFFLFFSVSSYAIEMGALMAIPLNTYYEPEETSQQFNVFELKLKENRIGKIYTLVDEPQLQKVETLSEASSTSPGLKIVYYDAGAVGTINISQMDRIAIFSYQKNEKKWNQIGDQAIAIRRYQGTELILTLERSWKWDPKNLKLSFAEFDEFKAISFVWDSKSKNFVNK